MTGDNYKKRKRIFEIIQIGNKRDVISRACDFVIVIAIILNITVTFLETFEELSRFMTLFRVTEDVTVIMFIAEYALRIWTSDFLFPGKGRAEAAFAFIRSPDGVIILLTILPFFFLSGFVMFRMLRVVRILQLFRVNASIDSFNVILDVLYTKKKQLASSVFIILILMFASSLFMYSAEHEAQPEAFKNAFSGIWWSMSTMLTVGYGDISPVTTVGQIMGIIIAFLGVGAVAIPTGIISAGFVERYQEMQNSEEPTDIILQTVAIDIDSKWIGMSSHEVQEGFGVRIVMARRGDAQILPNSDYRVCMRDKLVIYKEPKTPQQK